MKRLVLGLALTPNLGGALAALVETVGQGRELQATLRRARVEPFRPELQSLLARVAAGGAAEVRTLATAHRALGEAYAAAAVALADQAEVRLPLILCLGIESLVIHHEGGGPAATQLGMGAAACVAERTGATVASDFAWRDLAAGGHGLPLQALPDFLLFRDDDETRVIVHLDATAAATFLPAGGDDRAVRAAFAGPGQAFLDSLMSQLTGGREKADPTGHLAVQGRCLPELLERWRSHPFLLKKWPKSAAPNLFADEMAKQTVLLAQQKQWDARDLLCTANHWIAETAGAAVRRLRGGDERPATFILAGAGAKNGLLWRLLEEQWPGSPQRRGDDFGWPSEALPAVRAALLAALLLDREPANLPAATGAAGGRLLGQLTPGGFANWSACLAWMTDQAAPDEEGE